MQTFRVGVLSAFVLSIAFCLQPCFAQTSIQQTASNLQSVPPSLNGAIFPLLKIAECDRQGLIYQSSDFSVSIHGATLEIQDHDLTGNAWEAQTTFNGPGCEIFQADLDVNGKPDLIIRTPGIGSRGLYDTHLTILLFDDAGKPIPWSATGNFSLAGNGVKEITRSSSGRAIILHSYLVGHPAWDGVSSISKLYQFVDAKVSSIEGTHSGIEFPRISGAREADSAFRKTVSLMSLSTTNSSEKPSLLAQNSNPRFVRFGADTPVMAKAQSNAPLTAEQGANLTIDTESLNAGAEHIILSDGSKLELPTILVIDSVNGNREIIFSPDSGDLTLLGRGSYSIQQVGTDCQDGDECHPFILHSVEQKL